MSVYKDKKTGKWYFRVYITDPVTNERIQKSKYGFELKRDAMDAEYLFVRNSEMNRLDNTSIKVGSLIDEFLIFLEKKVKITTLVGHTYKINKYIRPTFEKIQIRNLTKTTFLNWYSLIDNSKVNTNTKNKILGLLKNIFDYAESEYDLRVRYFRNLSLFKNDNDIHEKKELVIYDEIQMKVFLDNTENHIHYMLFKTLYYTGMRISELRGLKWIDVSFETNTIMIRRQLTSKVPGGSVELTPKSKSSIRTIHIPTHLMEELKGWNELRKTKKNYSDDWRVFGDAGMVHETSIRRWLDATCERANLKRIKLHGMRHSYTTLLYNNRVPANIVKEQLGHSSVQITLDVYTHLSEKDKQDTIDNVFKNDMTK